MRTSSVCFVLFLRLLTWKLGWDQPVVALIRFSSTAGWRHYVGIIRGLVKAGSVGFVEAVVEHVGLFFVAKKAGAKRFIIVRVQANDIFFVASIWTYAHR